MYQLSRSIYRELAPEILEDHVAAAAGSNHERVLRACEAAVYRLATDRHYFAKPSKTLFREIRVYFPMSAQDRVFRVVDRYMTFAREWFEAQPSHGYDLAGNRLECRATTRKGTPCQRVPLPHNGYCPSHQHLADGDFGEPGVAEAPGTRVAA
jgi:hypothetical protein